MNIFVLDRDPKRAARMLCDKHVVKMILESTQLLCTAHRVLDGTEYIEINPKTNRRMKRWQHPVKLTDALLYKATHVNHGCSVWVRMSNKNYEWLHSHALEMCDEYTRRYGKTHACLDLLLGLWEPPEKISFSRYSYAPYLAMPREFQTDDCVESYRRYYVYDKIISKGICTWKAPSKVPEWVSEILDKYIDVTTLAR